MTAQQKPQCTPRFLPSLREFTTGDAGCRGLLLLAPGLPRHWNVGSFRLGLLSCVFLGGVNPGAQELAVWGVALRATQGSLGRGQDPVALCGLVWTGSQSNHFMIGQLKNWTMVEPINLHDLRIQTSSVEDYSRDPSCQCSGCTNRILETKIFLFTTSNITVLVHLEDDKYLHALFGLLDNC